jgi:hypothetical protein
VGSAYVMIILDDSGSMGLGMHDDTPGSDCYSVTLNQPLPLNGDDPCSKLSTAKRIIYEVFQSETKLSYGFVSYDQNNLQVLSKHWLYTPQSRVDFGNGIVFPVPVTTPASVARYVVLGEPFNTGPSSAADGPTACDVTTDSSCRGGALNKISHVATVGTPSTPFDLSKRVDRLRVSRFPHLGIYSPTAAPSISQGDANWETQIYLKGTDSAVYRLSVTRRSPLDPNVASNLVVMHLALVRCNNANCNSNTPIAAPAGGADVTLNLEGGFFYVEANAPNAYIEASNPSAINTNDLSMDGSGEVNGGYWAHSDVYNEVNCNGGAAPHSGLGWEGNYDGTFAGTYPPSSTALPLTPAQWAATPSPAADNDPANSSNTGAPVLPGPVACSGANRNSPACYNLKLPTAVDSSYTCPAGSNRPGQPVRVLDKGDFLPWDWRHPYHSEFLDRLSPNGSDFGAAKFFADLPDSTGLVPVLNPGQKPLIPVGATTFKSAYTDLRCFYMKDSGGQKCKNDDNPYSDCSWKEAAAAFDPNAGCTQPYVITVSDAIFPDQRNSCDEKNNFCGDIGNMKSEGVQTWGIILQPRGGQCAYKDLVRDPTGNTYHDDSDQPDQVHQRTSGRRWLSALRRQRPSVSRRTGRTSWARSRRSRRCSPRPRCPRCRPPRARRCT